MSTNSATEAERAQAAEIAAFKHWMGTLHPDAVPQPWDAWQAARAIPLAAAEPVEEESLAEEYSDMLRQICFEFSAGGYNSDGLMLPATADAKIRWVIEDVRQASLWQAARAAPDRAPSTDSTTERDAARLPDHWHFERMNAYQIKVTIDSDAAVVAEEFAVTKGNIASYVLYCLAADLLAIAAMKGEA